MTNTMASQLAQLLAESDLAELEEVVKRWLKDATSKSEQMHCQKLGTALLQLKRRLTMMSMHPSRDELEMAMSVMLSLAATRHTSNG